MAVFLLVLAWHKWSHSMNFGMPGMMGRVFLFDYLIFLLGGLSGWNMARRWRGSADTVEELSLTSLNPGVVGHVFMAGSLSIWFWMMLLLLSFDLVTPIIFVEELAGLDTGALIALTPFLLIIPVVLTWFHYESVHLAHWMFAIHGIPRVSLWKAAIGNFLLMMVIVFALSAAGSMITGALSVVFVMVLSIAIPSSGPDFWIESYTAWALGCVPGAALVAWLKRLICRAYERQFLRGWLLYQWWGAAESRQPNVYPLSYRSHLAYWAAYYAMGEERNSDIPIHRRHATRRYQHLLEIQKRQKEVAGSEPPGPAHRPAAQPPARIT